jgi:hypothetical protein
VNSRTELVRLLEERRFEHCLLETPAGGWALVVPRLAARVLGAGLGERNAFWVSPALERCLEGLDWNAGGQRTWIAPELGPRGFFGAGESHWAAPAELDPGAYRLESADLRCATCRGACRLRAADGEEFRLEIERWLEIRDLPAGVLLRLRHSLRNTGRVPIATRAGLWSIVQVPSLPEGTLLLPDDPYRTCFGELPSAWVLQKAGRLELRTAPGRRWKIGQRPSGPEAVIAHQRPEAVGGAVRVAMRCPFSPEGLYLDGGDVLQAYNSPLSGEDAFSELECHAPAAHLAAGEQYGQELEIEVHYEA